MIATIGKLDTKLVVCKKEENKWTFVMSQIQEINKYHVTNFLAEKPLKNLDENVLYTCRKIMIWRILNL